MKNTLKELWNGNIEPWSEKWERADEAEKLSALLERHKRALAEQLNAKGRETLDKYEDCYEELESIGCESAFIKGFCLAAKLLAEALKAP